MYQGFCVTGAIWPCHFELSIVFKLTLTSCLHDSRAGRYRSCSSIPLRMALKPQMMRRTDRLMHRCCILHHYDDQSVDTLMLNWKAGAMNMIDVIIHFLAKILKPGRPGESYRGSCSKSNGITFRWSSHRTGWCQRKLVRKNSARLD